MRRQIVGIYKDGDYKQAVPYIYDGTAWVYAKPKVYISGWKDVGGAGTLFYSFLESAGNIYNSTNTILVKDIHDKHDVLTDSSGNFLLDSEDFGLVSAGGQ